MIYLDSSAMFKIVWEEAESPTLRTWLNERLDAPLFSSVLGKIELIRGCRRYDETTLGDAHTLLAQVNFLPMRTYVVDAACDVGEGKLRSLDAIHLASALSMRAELSAFCAYDHRLQDSAAAAGFSVIAPGQ